MKQILWWEGNQSPLLPAALQASSQEDTQAPGPHRVSDPQGGGGTGQPQRLPVRARSPESWPTCSVPPSPAPNLLQSLVHTTPVSQGSNQIKSLGQTHTHLQLSTQNTGPEI